MKYINSDLTQEESKLLPFKETAKKNDLIADLVEIFRANF